MTSPAPLAGRVALVTGASRRSAIGAAVVRRLISDGAAVLVHSWAPADGERSDPGAAEQLVAELVDKGGRLAHISADLADPASPAQLVAVARESFGRLDMVIANHARSTRQSLEKLTAAEVDLTYAVNTRATLVLVQEFAAQFEAGSGGRVVLFTSGQYHGVMPGELPYIASKAALRELTPTLAAHLMPHGITVNCVNPGANNTGYANDAAWAWVAERNPGPSEHTAVHGPAYRMVGQRRSRVGDRTGHRLRRRLVHPRRVSPTRQQPRLCRNQRSPRGEPWLMRISIAVESGHVVSFICGERGRGRMTPRAPIWTCRCAHSPRGPWSRGASKAVIGLPISLLL